MLFSVLVVLQLGSGGPALAPECGAGGREGTNVWERAKHPELRHYCDLLASGAAKLAATATMAREVVGIANEADKTNPGRAAPLVLRGRAQMKLLQYEESYQSFVEAKKRDPNAVEDPVALLAFARAASRSGHEGDARDAFRALLPRASALSATERGLVYLEAGLLSMAKGAPGLDDAIVALRQARREAQDYAATLTTLALALALDRAGNRDEAKAILDERARADARTIVNDGRAKEALGPMAIEVDAMVAIGLEPTDAPRAKEAWARYVAAAGTGPWADHARGRAGLAAAPRAGASTGARPPATPPPRR
jgi:tetratricopeptide (TPR) repeat protein